MNITLNIQQYNTIFQLLQKVVAEPAETLQRENIISRLQHKVRAGMVGDVLPESIDIDLATVDIYLIFEGIKQLANNKVNVQDLAVLRFASTAVKCSKKFTEYLANLKSEPIPDNFEIDADDLD